MDNEIKKALNELLQRAETMSSDVGALVEEMLREGLENPLSADEVDALLTKVIETVRTGAEKRGDTASAGLLARDADALIKRAKQVRGQLSGGAGVVGSADNDTGTDNRSNPSTKKHGHLHLESFDGIDPVPVKPSPVFHERPVPVIEGFVRTRNIRALGPKRTAPHPLKPVPTEIRPPSRHH